MQEIEFELRQFSLAFIYPYMYEIKLNILIKNFNTELILFKSKLIKISQEIHNRGTSGPKITHVRHKNS